MAFDSLAGIITDKIYKPYSSAMVSLQDYVNGVKGSGHVLRLLQYWFRWPAKFEFECR